MDANTSTLLIIIGFLVIQLALAVVAIVYVVKTPPERIRQVPIIRENSKIFWIILAIVGNFTGAILSLILARTPVPLYEKEALKSSAKQKGQVVDMLYSKDKEDQNNEQ